MDAMSDVMLRRLFFILSTVIPPMVCSPNSVISVSDWHGLSELDSYRCNIDGWMESMRCVAYQY